MAVSYSFGLKIKSLRPLPEDEELHSCLLSIEQAQNPSRCMAVRMALITRRIASLAGASAPPKLAELTPTLQTAIASASDSVAAMVTSEIELTKMAGHQRLTSPSSVPRWS